MLLNKDLQAKIRPENYEIMLGEDITLKVRLKLSMKELKMLVIAITDNTHNVLVIWLSLYFHGFPTSMPCFGM